MGADSSDADDPVGQDNRKLKDEMSQHEAQLAALKERDPDFYAYLKQTDQELLDFKADEDESDQVFPSFHTCAVVQNHTFLHP